MKLLLDNLIVITKKLGAYEYRFGVTSQQMFSSNSSNKQIGLSDSDDSPIKSTIQEWKKHYEDYLKEISQIEAKLTYLTQKNLLQTESSKTQEDNSLVPQESDEDGHKFVEIRLPIGKIKSEFLKKSRARQTTYYLGLGKIIKNSDEDEENTSYTVLVNLQINRNQIDGNDYPNKLVRLRNGKCLDIPKAIRYDGFDHPITNVSYSLEASDEFWNEVIEKIEDLTSTESPKNLENLSLSIFTSSLDNDESNYKVVHLRSFSEEDNNNRVTLQIPIQVDSFHISEGIYWLYEAGYPTDFKWKLDPHGRFGCLGERIYPITQTRADYYANSFIRKGYPIDTPEHDLGKETLGIVKASLERLEGFEAWASNHDSKADVELKWDLFYKFEDKVYPLQIKSSLRGAEEALAKYKTMQLPFIPPIIWVNPQNKWQVNPQDQEENAKKLVEDLAIRFSLIFNIPISQNINSKSFFLDRKDKISVVDKLEEMKWRCSGSLESITHHPKKNKSKTPKPILRTSLVNIDHISTDKKAHESYMEQLRKGIKNDEWDEEAENILVSIKVRNKNLNYSSEIHEGFIAEMINLWRNLQ